MNLQELDMDDFTAFEGGASTSAYSSPALASVFDMSGSASSSATNMGTVSPQDLLLQEPFMSAPNSTALTALTSPSIYNESPEFGDTYDVSPSFESGDFDNGSTDAWFPLFPPNNAQLDASQKPATTEQSPATKSDDLELASALGHRRKSSGTSPPTRPSSIAGVGSRRRDKPLPPIIVSDPTDVTAMKRARNTLAARKSRERKALRLDELEEKIAKLTAERDHWKSVALAHGAKE
jgi:general control protein GCN4